MKFPTVRPRRLRSSRALRGLVAETDLSPERLIAPLFVQEDAREPVPVDAMPGVYRWPVGGVAEEAKRILEEGVDKFLIFGIPARKDEAASEAYNPNGVVQRALRELRRELGERATLMTDVCMCQYTSHGHCGIVARRGESWRVDNDATLPYMGKIAVSHAEAGADVVAPSSMMDGVVGQLRESLDEAGFTDVLIMAYSVKYASSFYGPFREAAESAPAFGDRRTYQMDPRNAMEALKEAELDVEEGADILMVKPAIPYLDVIRLVKEAFPQYPLAAYSMSGEYSALRAAGERGWLDEDRAVLEVLYAIRRAGADAIITYYAPRAARLLRELGGSVF
ncbi:MAG: porphobilinogen synthase [Conexivisphaera sp.]